MTRPRMTALLLTLALAASLMVQATVGPLPAWAAAPVQSLGGNDRVANAVVASETAYSSGAGQVLIASVEDFADALSAAALSGVTDAPVLYARRGELPQATAQEIRRLGATRAVLLGGQNALSEAVADQVRAAGVADVTRVSGVNRFDTAGRVGRMVTDRSGATGAFLALGSHPEPTRAWADAVAVSALANRTGQPTLLSGPDRLPVETRDAITGMGLRSITIVGGSAAIQPVVEQDLRDMGLTVTRLAGASRYETSLRITEELLRRGAGTGELWITSGGNYADPLVAGPAAARLGGVLMLADAANFGAQPVAAFLVRNRTRIGVVRLLGGTDTFGTELVSQMQAILSSSVPEDAVIVGPGTQVSGLFGTNPPGSTFAFMPGTHHEAQIPARSGDTYVGFTGTVLDGSRVLPASSFTTRDGRYVATGISSTLPTGGTYGCRSWLEDPSQFALCGHEQEVHRSEQLFLAGDRLRHVNSIPEVNRPGTWFYDAGEGAVWMFDDPASAEVRLSDAWQAFGGFETRDVTIADMVITRYGSPAQQGVINALDTVNWVIRDVEVSHGHGYGIRIGRNTTITGSRLIDNGQLGAGGSAFDTPVTITNNSIAHNGELGFQQNFEIGGVKVTHSIGAVMANNHAYDNAAKGLWMDGLNRNATIHDNLVERSGQTGILYEISYDATIYGNTLIDNHTSGDTVESYGSLQVVNSRNVDVYDNVMRGGGKQELTVYDTDLPPGVGNVRVYDNDITIDTTWNEGTYGLKDLRADKSSPIPGIVFDNNTIRVVQSADRPYAWDSQLIGAGEWLSYFPGDRFITGG